MSVEIEAGQLPEKSLENVAFLPNGNEKMDEVELYEKDPKPSSKFGGLTKEELSEFADDPFWVRTRRILFVAFWVVWVAMIIAAAAIIALSPRCPAKPPQKWWDTGIVYRVFVKSFKDSNEDGRGDFNGLRENLDHVAKLQAKALALSPFFATSSVEEETGTDVVDFKAPNEALGTLAEAQALFKECRKRGLKIILEIDPNHSSKDHPNFKKSALKSDNLEDYYVWSNTSDANNPPKGWKGEDGKSPAWFFNAKRGEWYYSRKGAAFPELNYWSVTVKNAMMDVFRFWMDEGVDGFFLHSAAFLYESKNLEDTHGFVNQPASHVFIAEIRKVLDDYTSVTGKDYVLIVDGQDGTGTTATQNQFYHDGTNPGANIVVNNQFLTRLNCRDNYSGVCISDLVDGVANSTDSSDMRRGNEAKWGWPNWAVSSPAAGRLGSRLKGRDELKDAFNLLLLTMRGTPILWYGDEIGMSASNPRSPMQWDETKFAGFTMGDDPWLPVHADAGRLNVKFEEAIGNDNSILSTFLVMAKLRQDSKSASFMYGDMILAGANENLFSFVRKARGHPAFYIAINFGKAPTAIPEGLSTMPKVPEVGTVVVTTANAHPDFKVGKTIEMSKEHILLKPGQGVVLKLGPATCQP